MGSCYHPLKAWPIGTTDNGKIKYKVTSYVIDHVEYNGKSWESSTVPIMSDRARRAVRNYTEIPCGKCIGCRLQYSRQWANRCMLEASLHDSNYFVTLTYDDAHLPISYAADPDTGEAIPHATLVKRDMQLFFKRLRKRFGCGIRFFSCGEYGSKTFRPHYHAIIFGLHLDDLIPYKRSPLGYQYYNSPSMSSVWPYGYVVIGDVSWDACAYTARYVLKKQVGETAHIYDDLAIEPEFCNMSRRPGIARDYYDQHPDMFDYNQINLCTPTGGVSFPPPKYFERLFEVDYPEQAQERKDAKRALAENEKRLKCLLTDNDYLDMLKIEEVKKRSRIKSLTRKLD